MNDFKSQDGTEIIVSTAQNNLREKLIENIKTKTEEKYQKVVVSLMTNGRELQISEVKSITDSIKGYLGKHGITQFSKPTNRSSRFAV